MPGWGLLCPEMTCARKSTRLFTAMRILHSLNIAHLDLSLECLGLGMLGGSNVSVVFRMFLVWVFFLLTVGTKHIS